jgi:hypothetical protein
MQHDLAIQQLKATGARQGHVTLEQIKRVLPVDEMTPEEIGRIVMRLEDQGVEVRLENDLLRPRADADADGIAASDSLLDLEADPERAPPTPLGARAPASTTSPARAGPSASGQGSGHHDAALWAIVGMPILIVVSVLLLVVLLR